MLVEQLIAEIILAPKTGHFGDRADKNQHLAPKAG